MQFLRIRRFQRHYSLELHALNLRRDKVLVALCRLQARRWLTPAFCVEAVIIQGLNANFEKPYVAAVI